MNWFVEYYFQLEIKVLGVYSAGPQLSSVLHLQSTAISRKIQLSLEKVYYPLKSFFLKVI